MPDKDFTLPPGGFVLYADLTSGNATAISIPTPQRCRMVAAGVTRADTITAVTLLTFSSAAGTIGTLTMATGGTVGTDDIEFFSSAKIANGFGPTDSITVECDGNGTGNQPLTILMIMAPG